MTAKIEVYRNVLVSLGQRDINSLNDPSDARKVLDVVWNAGTRHCLSQGQWNFAARTISADDAASVDPAFGYQYAFTKPDDWVRTMGMFEDERGDCLLTRYLDEQGYWWADITPIYVRYVSSDPQYGLDLGNWPQSFASYVESHLAVRVAPRLAVGGGKGIAAATLVAMRQLERQMLNAAQSEDAMNQPPGFAPSGSWVNARRGRYSYFRDQNGRPR